MNAKEALKMINAVYACVTRRLEDAFDDDDTYIDDCFLLNVAREMAETALLDSTVHFYTTYSLYLVHIVSPIQSKDELDKLQRYIRALIKVFKPYRQKNPDNEKIRFLYGLAAAVFIFSYKDYSHPNSTEDLHLIHELLKGQDIQYIQECSKKKLFNLGMFSNIFSNMTSAQLEMCLYKSEKDLAVSYIRNSEKTLNNMLSIPGLKEKIEKALRGEDFELSLKEGMDLFTLMALYCGNMSLMASQQDELGSQYGISYYKDNYEKLCHFLYRKFDDPFEYYFSGSDSLVTFAYYYQRYAYRATKYFDSLTLDSDLQFEAIHKVAEVAAVHPDYAKPFSMLLYSSNIIDDEDVYAFYCFTYQRAKYLFEEGKFYDDDLLRGLLSFIEFAGEATGEIKKLRQDALDLVMIAIEKVKENERDDLFLTVPYCYKKSHNLKFIKQICKRLKQEKYSKEFIKLFKKETKFYA